MGWFASIVTSHPVHEMAPETSIISNQLTWSMAQNCVINLSCCERFSSYKHKLVMLYRKIINVYPPESCETHKGTVWAKY
jgi:hypothetical protein